MRPPVPISTLPDAARWMSELSGTPMTERELLGHAFNFQQAGPRSERVIHVIIPLDAPLQVRRWRRDGYTERLASPHERLVALDTFELLDLLTYDSAELALPRLTDPIESAEFVELVLESAIVTSSMARIYARGLYILAAWWQSTVGAAGPRRPTAPAALSCGSTGDTSRPTGLRKQPAGGDVLTPIIWTICYDLLEAGQRQSALPVMAALKSLADSSDRAIKGPLLSSVAGGIKYEDAAGDEKELSSSQLKSRIAEWKAAVNGQ